MTGGEGEIGENKFLGHPSELSIWRIVQLNDRGYHFSRHQDGSVIPRVITLIVIGIAYYYFLRWRHEKVKTDMVLLNITLFVLFLFISPFLMTI